MKTAKNLFLFLFIFIVNKSFCQSFSDYYTLENPIHDENIIGKTFNSGIFSGIGTKAFEVYDGNNSITTKDTIKFKASIQAIIGKIISGDVGANSSKLSVTNINNIKILTCNDFAQIFYTSEKAEYVVSAIEVGSFDIAINKKFDADLQAKLNFQVGQSLVNVNPSISYDKNKATVTLGKNLIVAVKRLKVTGTDAYIDNLSIINGNKVDYNDKFTKKDNSLFFASMPLMEATTFTTVDDVNDNKGVFYLWFTDSAVPDPTANGASMTRPIIIAPTCSEMKSAVKPDCDSYNPNPLFQNINFKQVIRSATSKYVVTYELSVNNLIVNYAKGPKPTIKLSNYTIDKVTGDIAVRKSVYYYKLLD